MRLMPTALTENAPPSSGAAMVISDQPCVPAGKTESPAHAVRRLLRRDLPLAGLLLFAVFIWVRERSWLLAPEDTVPVLAALPLCLWMGSPWEWKKEPGAVSPHLPALAVLLALAGILTDATVLLASSWCLLALTFCRAWLRRFSPRLLILALLGFPWIHQSAGAIGWWFRFTGAGVTGSLFSALGLSVTREGTFLVINHMPLSIEAACGGLGVLQAMLVAGMVVVLRTMPAGRPFWIASALLLPFAWLANTLRIFLLGLAGLIFSPEFAMGWFHTFGGWVVLCLMFLLCQTLLDAARRKLLKPGRTA